MENKLNYLFYLIIFLASALHAAFAAPKFLTISDIHYGSENKSREAEDIGDEFLKIAFTKLKELSKKADFILVLGDLPTHTLFTTPKKGQDEKKVFHSLFEADQGLKPMFYVAGNNDSLAGNYQPFEVNGNSPLNYATDWTGACVHCDGLLIDDKHMHHSGYYSSYVIPNNKDTILIALNTTQWVKTPFLLPKYSHQEEDAQAQLLWLEQQLKTHHAKQLLIAMHIPPGAAYTDALFWHEAYLNKFITLLQNNHKSYGQVTMLTAHTHMDEIRKINLKEGYFAYSYSTPSISRNHRNNPGMKMFFLDNDMAIKNYITYYTTQLKNWGNEQYQAIGSVNAIFPQCINKFLSECMVNLTLQQVCNSLEQKLFYGVKSDRVAKKACAKTYKIN